LLALEPAGTWQEALNLDKQASTQGIYGVRKVSVESLGAACWHHAGAKRINQLFSSACEACWRWSLQAISSGSSRAAVKYSQGGSLSGYASAAALNREPM
jgi:hypothetical protein